MRNNKQAFMRELEQLGLEVGEWGWQSNYEYKEGAFDISMEYGDHWKYADYYGEFRGGYMWISDELKDLGSQYGYYFVWYNAAILCAMPEHL